MADLNALAESVIRGDQNSTIEMTKSALAEGLQAKKILDEGLIGAMNTIAERWKRNEVYIPEVLIAARAMKSGMEVLEPELSRAGIKPIGKCLIGTVQGDLHDIGKNLVIMMLKGAGYDVIDLGIDVPPDKFVQAVNETNAQIVGMSALLTTTMPALEKTIKVLRGAGVKAKLIVGGAPVTQGYADKIGADGYSPDAASAVDLVKSLLN
ncbi:MAG: corrinoid protein [Sedimentisphaerales bacterium]|nr:corrinoid protein [Sedimentisphaerales bacterium]